MDEDTSAAETESTSEGAPEGSEESTSEEFDGSGEPEADEAEGESEAADEETDDGETQADEGEADEGEEEPEEYRNLVKKFDKLSEAERKRAIGKTYWEKTRYAAEVRKRNEELEAEIARLREETEKTKEPPPPPPDLQKAIQRIDTLQKRGEALQARQGDAIKKLNQADRELAIAKDRLSDVPQDDDRHSLAAARVRAAEERLESARDQYQSVLDQQEALAERWETAIAEKDWIERHHKEQESRLKTEQKRNERFNQEFVQNVRALVPAAAKHIKLELGDEKLEASLWRHVNRALQADIRGQYLDTDVEDIPVPQLVLSYVKEWADDLDMAKRRVFTQKSKGKLAVTAATRKPGDGKAPRPAGTSDAPARSSQPVPAALLSRSSTPLMERARKMLVQRLGGGR